MEITRVYENFSICKKIVVSELNPFQPIPIIKKQKKALELNVDEKDFSNIKYQDKSPIKKGDSIKILN